MTHRITVHTYEVEPQVFETDDDDYSVDIMADLETI